MPHAEVRRGATPRDAPARRVLGEGLVVVVEPSRALPLVDLELVLRTGAVHDPDGQDGLTRLTWRVVRMGTRSVRSEEVEDRLGALGARLAMEVAPSYVRVHGTVLRRHLAPFVELLARLVRRPAFRQEDFERAVRETHAELVAARDDDAFLAARHFRRFLFGEHPYGRTITGTPASLDRIRRRDLVAHHAAHLVAGNVVLGFAGDVSVAEAVELSGRCFSGLPAGPAPAERVPDARLPPGRRVLVVDKPERAQAQVYVGTLGGRQRDRDAVPLAVANTAFGGTFSGRLMQEVREKRGWSYGAYSRLGQDRARDAWAMWTFPAVKDAVDCIALELDLLDAWVEGGLRPAEIRFAKRSLVQGHCFEVDTPSKRLDPRLDEEVFDLPRGHFARQPERVREVTTEAANAAVARRISRRDVAIVLVASARDVVPGLEGLPGVVEVTRLPYDRDGDEGGGGSGVGS